MAVPHFVIDAPDGGGKIPLLPDGYLVQIDDQNATLKNYEDKTFNYPQPNDNLISKTASSCNISNGQPTTSRLNNNQDTSIYPEELNGHQSIPSSS